MQMNIKEKNAVRGVVFDNVAPVKTALLFPSTHMYCVKEGIGRKVFSRDTRFIFIERDGNTAQTIQARSKAMGLKNIYIHHGQAHELDVNTIKTELGNLPLEFAFLDFCGQLTNDLVFWLTEISPLFSAQATIAMTYSLRIRQNVLLDKLKEHDSIDKWHRQLIKDDVYQGDRSSQWLKSTMTLSCAAINTGVTFKPTEAITYKSLKTPMLMVKGLASSTRPKLKLKEFEELRLAA